MFGPHSRLYTMATLLIVLGMLGQATGQSGQQSSADELVSAIWRGDLNTVHSFLSKGVELNARNIGGTTPLVEASNYHPDLAEELVANGADPNFPTITGGTPLMHAALNCQLELARFLLERDARVDASDRDGETALMHAAWACQDARMVHLLLEAGAAVNDRSNDGATPLMMAAQIGNEGAVKALVAAGADLNATDNDGETAFTLAQASRYMLNKKAHKRIYAYLRRVSKEASRHEPAPR
jgi:ankyrin repeat protein